jgi:hypothetical protein
MYPVQCKEIVKCRFRESAFERDQHRLIIFIAVMIDHDENLFELLENVERQTPDQMRILQGDMWRQQGCWYTSAKLHGVQTQVP